MLAYSSVTCGTQNLGHVKARSQELGWVGHVEPLLSDRWTVAGNWTQMYSWDSNPGIVTWDAGITGHVSTIVPTANLVQ